MSGKDIATTRRAFLESLQTRDTEKVSEAQVRLSNMRTNMQNKEEEEYIKSLMEHKESIQNTLKEVKAIEIDDKESINKLLVFINFFIRDKAIYDKLISRKGIDSKSVLDEHLYCSDGIHKLITSMAIKKGTEHTVSYKEKEEDFLNYCFDENKDSYEKFLKDMTELLETAIRIIEEYEGVNAIINERQEVGGGGKNNNNAYYIDKKNKKYNRKIYTMDGKKCVMYKKKYIELKSYKQLLRDVKRA